jgi:hypothetical protein
VAVERLFRDREVDLALEAGDEAIEGLGHAEDHVCHALLLTGKRTAAAVGGSRGL